MGYEECDAWREAEEDAAYEHFYAQIGPQWAEDHAQQLFEQNYGDAVEQFTAERLASAYLRNPLIAEQAQRALLYAQSLMPRHHKAAFVFAMTSTELTIKTVLLRPIVFGLIHTEHLAGFVSDLAIQHTGMEKFNELLTEILSEYGGVDLKKFKRSNSNLLLMQEIASLNKPRNGVVHRGEDCDVATTELALSIASTLINEVFPTVLKRLGLNLDDRGAICGSLKSLNSALDDVQSQPRQ